MSFRRPVSYLTKTFPFVNSSPNLFLIFQKYLYFYTHPSLRKLPLLPLLFIERNQLEVSSILISIVPVWYTSCKFFDVLQITRISRTTYTFLLPISPFYLSLSVMRVTFPQNRTDSYIIVLTSRNSVSAEINL